MIRVILKRCLFAAALPVSTAFAQPAPDTQPDTAALRAEVKRLEQRIDELEKRKQAEEDALDKPVISADEPPVASRLKAVESQANHQKKASELAESLEDITVSAALTTMAQGISGNAGDTTHNELNYRGDVTISVPMGSLGNSSDSLLFTHLRMGQGRGLQAPGTAFSGVNSTSFQRPGTEVSDSTVLLGEAWYQLNQPLPLGGNAALSRRHLEFNFGKMDPFAFFDKNAVGNDETAQFVNQSFVHNPLLDTGGDIGVDSFGFTPGLRFAYVDETTKPQTYGISVGIFGAGNGAGYDRTLQSAMTVVQLETAQHFFAGLPGHYRVYGWHNAAGVHVDGTTGAHEGVGFSIDQRAGDYLTLFARAGYELRGEVKFDRALTLGGEIGGSYWNRGADAIGFAVGALQTSRNFRRQSLTVDADADGVADYGYRASGAEYDAELYYRYFLNKQFTVTPSLQVIARPGGNGDADTFTVFGTRVQLGY